MTSGSPLRRILLSRDFVVALLGVVVLAAVCVALGLWQFGRFEGKRDAAQTIRSNYEAAPVPLDQVLPDIGAPLAPQDEWTPVALQGSYCADPRCVLYVRNRQLSSTVGFWQLVPFRTQDGTTLLVVRGWVPSAAGESEPLDPPPVPAGERTVTVRLRPSEVVLDRRPPPGQTHSVNPPQSAELMGLDSPQLVTQAYGELKSEEPDAPRPRALEAPDTSLGPHLSYAVQWWVFALFFPGALVHRTRRQLQDLAAEDPSTAREPGITVAGGDAEGPPVGPGSRAAPPARPDSRRPRRPVHSRRKGQDEEEEDALIDQQGL